MNSPQIHPDLKPPGTNTHVTDKPANSQGRRYLVWSLATALLVLALIVLFVLPTRITEQPQQDINPINVIVANTPTRPAVAVEGVAQQDAGLALQAFLRLRAQADLNNAEIWAPQAWSSAMRFTEEGDDHYGHRRFKQAQLAYQAASQTLKTLQTDRPQRLSDTLKSGQTLLQDNNIALAIEAFERVLAMQKDHSQAKVGLQQARIREQILSLMEEGQQAEKTNNFTYAAEVYATAGKLDSAYKPAHAALQKVTDRLNDQKYQDAMSLALNKLESGNLNAADDALKTAAGIKPDATALLDTQLRLQDAQRQSKLNNLRKQAQQRAAKENWPEAAELYRKALSIDKQTSFARNGLEFANDRIQLNAQLDHFLQAPERLSSDEPLQNAKTLLAANPGTPINEPRLATKISQLKTAVRLATTPVILQIESDNLTAITIYHVGRMGVFEQKQISLRPGRYTVTGSRTGYRDVRRVITLSPDTPAVLSLRCEEPI